MVLIDHEAVKTHFLAILVFIQVAVKQAMGDLGIKIRIGKRQA
jgi:hypothetical protein